MRISEIGVKGLSKGNDAADRNSCCSIRFGRIVGPGGLLDYGGTNTMNQLAFRRQWMPFLICCFLMPSLSSAQVEVNRQRIIAQARNAQYNLRGQGLIGFECSVTPNWDALLVDSRKTNPDGVDRAVKILSQLHFVAKLGQGGKVLLTHNELIGYDQQTMDGLRQIYG